MDDGEPILEDLLAGKGVSSTTIARAQTIAASGRTSLLRTLSQMGELPDAAYAEIVSALSGFPILDDGDAPPEAVETPLSIPFMRARQVIPVRHQDGRIDVAFVNPLDTDAVAGVRFALRNMLGDLMVIPAAAWRRAFSEFYDHHPSSAALEASVEDQVLARIFDQDRDAPIARRVASFLSEAVARRASDLHVEARRNHVDIRLRVDGRLEQLAREPLESAAALIARIKVLADLDLGERRRPQDGRTTIVVGGRQIDVRVSIVPAADGESAVLRLLDRPSGLLTLEGLGFSPDHQREIERIMRARDGLFIVAGPTGSGKTTTLYACLHLLVQSGLKIVSVEDPIEYHFGHVIQVQTSDAAGVDFPNALRSFLRHDPDVILVGEIRDRETAQVAVQAALTGHLVVASIHAIDAPRVIARLVDMGVDRYQLDAALRAALSQRLVRALCSCARPVEPDEQTVAAFARAGLTAPAQVAAPVGCEACGGSGFQGRLVVAELQSEPAGGMFRDGMMKLAARRTTLSEILFAVEG